MTRTKFEISHRPKYQVCKELFEARHQGLLVERLHGTASCRHLKVVEGLVWTRTGPLLQPRRRAIVWERMGRHHLRAYV